MRQIARRYQIANEFDSYALKYRKIINDVSRVSGEKYEFFIHLRVSLMKHRLTMIGFCSSVRRILDFGCGIGAAGEIMELAFPYATIVGVDSSEDSIVEARRLGLRRTEFVYGRDGALPLKENSVDLVYSNGVFHHINSKNQIAMLRKLYNVVRPGGHIFIFENNPANPLMMRAMAKNPFDANAKTITPRKLSNLLDDSGFRVLRTSYYFIFPHSLRFLRWSEPMFERLPLGAQYFVWAVSKK